MLDWIMAIVQLCREGIAAGKTLKEWRESQLTDREKELLRAAAKDGLFHLLCDDASGRHVLTATREFSSQSDPAITAHYLDAFIRLCSRGLVIDQGEELFRLTGQGFDLARELVEKESRLD